MNEEENAIRALELEIVEGWNARSAEAMTKSWSDAVRMVGFDGTEVNGRDNATRSLAKIFADHEVARYVCLVRGIRHLQPGVALLQAHVGMVAPKKVKIMADRNAVQTLLAVLRDGRWQTELFQNTPAKWDGRAGDVDALTEELQASFDSMNHPP
ncbi:MAG: SgcJ/EcaC family oxidoreductase [Rhodanobacteraceae bacterium]